MDKKIIQVNLNALSLGVRGTAEGEEDVNLFRFTLSYPTEGIPNVETVKTVSVNKPIPTNWDDFEKSIIFKTALRGRAKLTIEAASIDKESDGEKFIKGLFKSLFGAVLGVWTGGFGSAYVGAITKAVGTSLTDLIESDDDIDILGKASVMIDSDNLQSEIDLSLKVDKPVVKKVRQLVGAGPRPRRRARIVEEVLLAKGAHNGNVKIGIAEIG